MCYFDTKEACQLSRTILIFALAHPPFSHSMDHPPIPAALPPAHGEDAADAPKCGKKRGSYNCGRCGLPKKGHNCTVNWKIMLTFYIIK